MNQYYVQAIREANSANTNLLSLIENALFIHPYLSDRAVIFVDPGAVCDNNLFAYHREYCKSINTKLHFAVPTEIDGEPYLGFEVRLGDFTSLVVDFLHRGIINDNSNESTSQS